MFIGTFDVSVVPRSDYKIYQSHEMARKNKNKELMVNEHLYSILVEPREGKKVATQRGPAC